MSRSPLSNAYINWVSRTSRKFSQVAGPQRGAEISLGGRPPGLLLEPPLTSTVYMSEPDVQDIVRCLLGLPLLPADEICPAFDDVKLVVSNDSRFVNKLNDLLRYAGRHRTQKHSIGLARLCAVITGTEQTAS